MIDPPNLSPQVMSKLMRHFPLESAADKG